MKIIQRILKKIFHKKEKKDWFELFYNEITNWQLKTFPDVTIEGGYNHLLKEIKELKQEIDSDKFNTIEFSKEFADCLFLLFFIAKKKNVDYNSLKFGLFTKYIENLERDWKVKNSEGFVEHVK